MIALLALAPLTVDGADLDALGKAAVACERPAMNKAAADETQRHSRFVLDSFREQAAVVAARAELAGRRDKLRTQPGVPTADTEASLAVATLTLADRQQALDDARTLDRLRQDAFGWFRQLYLNQCQGKASQ